MCLQLLSCCLTVLERNKGFITSGLQFSFWLLLAVTQIVPFYSLIELEVSLSVFLSVCLPVCLSACLSVCLMQIVPFYSLIELEVSLSVCHLSVCLPDADCAILLPHTGGQSVCHLSACLSACPSACLSACLSVCLTQIVPFYSLIELEVSLSACLPLCLSSV